MIRMIPASTAAPTRRSMWGYCITADVAQEMESPMTAPAIETARRVYPSEELGL